MRALLTRLKRLENVRAAEHQPTVELQFGYLRKLSPEYTGERHVVTVGRHPDGTYRREERPGLAPANEEEGNARRIIRINLVPSPHEELPAPASSEAEQPRNPFGNDRLEDCLAPQATNQILIVVADAAQKLALDSGRCVQILREAGPHRFSELD